MTIQPLSIYLDHNATTPIHPLVKEKIIESLDIYGNASSLHPFGYKAREEIERTRSNLLEYLGNPGGRIIFTSGGSESNNLVLKGLVCEGAVCPKRFSEGGNPHVITTAVEHPSVLNTASCVNRLGADVTVIKTDHFGMVDPDDIRKAVRPNTVLVSVMYANNEVGTIQPVEEIGRILGERQIAFHCDAVQAVGKLPMDVGRFNIDYLSLSGHKINAPKGIGALYVRSPMSLCPLIHGGHQESNLRAGTENTLGILALGKAVEIMRKPDHEKHTRRILALRDLLEERIRAETDGVTLNGHREQRLPNTLNLSFDRVDGAAVLEMLAMRGIGASSGSACSSGDEAPSHVLSAMQVSPERSRSSVRLSLGYGNTEEEIVRAAETINDVIRRLRAMSPL